MDKWSSMQAHSCTKRHANHFPGKPTWRLIRLKNQSWTGYSRAAFYSRAERRGSSFHGCYPSELFKGSLMTIICGTSREIICMWCKAGVCENKCLALCHWGKARHFETELSNVLNPKRGMLRQNEANAITRLLERSRKIITGCLYVQFSSTGCNIKYLIHLFVGLFE